MPIPEQMSAAPRPGMLVHQDVRLLRPLCQGGMGSVWAAEHRKLRTEVAVKLIAANLAEDAVARTRFEREATSASRVRSPHVVQILDYGVSPHGHPFIVMELLEGRDLRTHLQERLRDEVALPATEALSITKQLCHALGKAHEGGIVHRDLKPSNVFLCDSPQETLVKLLDFGIAKETGIDGALSTTAAIGTPFYMSPEQLTGEQRVDHRSDIWSLGVLAFEMLAGRRPFEGATTGALALAIHTLPLPSARASNPSLPTAVDEWFARACARAPSARFDSAAEAARALEFALDCPRAVSPPKASPLAGPSTLTDQPGARVVPRRLPQTLAAVAAALLLAAAALLTMSGSSRAREPAPLSSPLTPSSPPIAPPLLSPQAVASTSTSSAEVRVEEPKPREPERALSAPPPVATRPHPRHPAAAPPPLTASVSPPAPSASATPPPPATVDEPSPLAIPVDRK